MNNQMIIPEINKSVVQEFGEMISVDEGCVLLQEGNVAKSTYFVLTGGIRLYFYTDIDQVTLEFFLENSFVSSFSSFLNNKPSTYWLETIEKSELYVIPKDNLQKLYSKSPDLKDQYMKGLEQRLSDYIMRLQTLLSLNAKDRYAELVKTRPDIIQRVKQKYIASYIGIKPESLSRLRSK